MLVLRKACSRRKWQTAARTMAHVNTEIRGVGICTVEAHATSTHVFLRKILAHVCAYLNTIDIFLDQR